jgi:hypothetical protein
MAKSPLIYDTHLPVGIPTIGQLLIHHSHVFLSLWATWVSPSLTI